MKICPEYEHTLWMDVYGELGPRERADWESHLSACSACRQERIHAMQMVGLIQEACAPAALEEMVIDQAVERIAAKSTATRNPSPSPRPWLFAPARLIPVAAAACILLMATILFTLTSETPAPDQRMAAVADRHERLQSEDLEVIRNLELLTEFEAIQQLVQVSTHPNSGPVPAGLRDGQIQGKWHNKGFVSYV